MFIDQAKHVLCIKYFKTYQIVIAIAFKLIKFPSFVASELLHTIMSPTYYERLIYDYLPMQALNQQTSWKTI